MIKIDKLLLNVFFVKSGEAPYSIVYYTSKKYFPIKIQLREDKGDIFIREFSLPWFQKRRIGLLFYKNGKISSRGILQKAGLYKGTSYWCNGKKKFKGICNDKLKNGSYYGPSYPIYGTFYNDKGKMVYKGKFKTSHKGGVSYPFVDYPESFGPISW